MGFLYQEDKNRKLFTDLTAIKSELERRGKKDCKFCAFYHECLAFKKDRRGSHAYCWQIVSLPVADVEEVVKCKDCKFRNSPTCFAKHETADLEYCSNGVRKEE